jgi:hypothetical protein
MRYLAAMIFGFLIESFGYPVGRFLLPLISFGRAHAEPLSGPDGKFNWFGYRRDEAGRIEIESSFTTLVGLVAGAILVSVAGFLIRLFA